MCIYSQVIICQMLERRQDGHAGSGNSECKAPDKCWTLSFMAISDVLWQDWALPEMHQQRCCHTVWLQCVAVSHRLVTCHQQVPSTPAISKPGADLLYRGLL